MIDHSHIWIQLVGDSSPLCMVCWERMASDDPAWKSVASPVLPRMSGASPLVEGEDFGDPPSVTYPFSMVVPSSGKGKGAPSDYLVVIMNEEGWGTCQCRGFRYQGTCRHLKEVIASLPAVRRDEEGAKDDLDDSEWL